MVGPVQPKENNSVLTDGLCPLFGVPSDEYETVATPATIWKRIRQCHWANENTPKTHDAARKATEDLENYFGAQCGDVSLRLLKTIHREHTNPPLLRLGIIDGALNSARIHISKLEFGQAIYTVFVLQETRTPC